MRNLIEAAAKRFSVQSEILDLINMQFISQVIEEYPSLLLPPIMGTLRHEQVLHGLDWMKQNVASLREEFLLLRRLYGPTWILA